MRKIAWIVFCVVLLSGVAFTQSITVTKPTANEGLYKGELYLITWTSSGSMANQVRIALVNEAANVIVLDIALETTNDGSHPWSIPLNAPSGRYKIAIRAKGSNITGLSPAFNIQMRRSGTRTPPPPEQRRVDYNVTVKKPDTNSRWNFGDMKDIMIETDFEAQYFRMDLTSGGQRVFPIHEGAIRSYAKEGDISKYRYRWNIPVQSTEKGHYRVRVKATSTQGEVEGLSASFYLSEEVTLLRDVIHLNPSVVNGSNPAGGVKPPGNQIRIGLAWENKNWVSYLAQIKFSFNEIKKKEHLLISAKLLLTKHKHNTKGVWNSCASDLYVLTAPWTDFSGSPRYLYKTFPEATLGGQRFEFDVIQQVRAWISEQEPNHGFLISWNSNDLPMVCVTHYAAILSIEYEYKE